MPCRGFWLWPPQLSNHFAKVRPRVDIVLHADEQTTMETMLRKRSIGQGIVLRAKIVLLCAQGLPDMRVAERTDVTHATVGKWRKRFIEYGVDGLPDTPRPSTPRTLGDEHAERVIKLTLESAPPGRAPPVNAFNGGSSGMSQATISPLA